MINFVGRLVLIIVGGTPGVDRWKKLATDIDQPSTLSSGIIRRYAGSSIIVKVATPRYSLVVSRSVTASRQTLLFGYPCTGGPKPISFNYIVRPPRIRDNLILTSS